MQTQVQKEDSVRLWNWVLKVNNVNIGLVKDAGLETETLVGQIKGHNGKLPPRLKLNWVKFKATMLEINFENLQKIFGWELTTIEGVSNTDNPGKTRKIITYDDLIKAITMYPVEFINTNANGEKFGVKIFQAYATNGLSLPFPSDEDLEASMEVPIEFGAYPNENNQYFELIDEQDVTA